MRTRADAATRALRSRPLARTHGLHPSLVARDRRDSRAGFREAAAAAPPGPRRPARAGEGLWGRARRRARPVGLVGALISGLFVGCGPNAGIDDRRACANGAHNSLNAKGECICDEGFSWCDAADSSDLSCCSNEDFDACVRGDHNHLVAGQPLANCVCDNGYDRCAPTDLLSLECCATPEAPPDACKPQTPPDPMACTTASEGAVFCTNDAEYGVCASQYYTCLDGMWTETSADLDAECVAEGSDFAYGCVDEGGAPVTACGLGPGTPCDPSTPAACVDTDRILACLDGKTTEQSCQTLCAEVGDGGRTWSQGTCRADGSTGALCYCCEPGDPGC